MNLRKKGNNLLSIVYPKFYPLLIMEYVDAENNYLNYGALKKSYIKLLYFIAVFMPKKTPSSNTLKSGYF